MLKQVKTVYGAHLWIDQDELKEAQRKSQRLIKTYRNDGLEIESNNPANGNHLIRIDSIKEEFIHV